jgi:hypothetical protein
MKNDNWISVDYLNQDDFYMYIQELSEDERAIELAQFSKRVGKKLLKEEMKKNNCFYNFIKSYSSRDFKIIKNKKYVSQRVICTHVKFWNETHPNNKIKNLRVFFY